MDTFALGIIGILIIVVGIALWFKGDQLEHRDK